VLTDFNKNSQQEIPEKHVYREASFSMRIKRGTDKEGRGTFRDFANDPADVSILAT
jgi:hypothetical protein